MEKYSCRVSATVVCALLAVTAFAQDAVTASNTGPYCSGSTIALSATGDPSAGYAWTGPNNYASDQQSPIIGNADGTNAGVYAVTVNGSASATTTVVVNSNAAIATGPHVTTTSTGTANGPDGASSYTWTVSGNGALTSGQNTKTATFTAGAPGALTLTLDTGCSATSQDVTVDPQPTITIDNPSVKPGPRGTITQLTFHIRLSAPSTQIVSVEYYTSNSTAIAGRDYQVTSGVAVFQPGTTEQDVTVNVYGTSGNVQKALFLNLYDAQNGSIQTIYGYPVKGRGVILAK